MLMMEQMVDEKTCRLNLKMKNFVLEAENDIPFLPMTTKTLFRQTLEEIPAETHIFIHKYTDILDRIQTILQRKGMKQRDLALALGKSESEVSKWLAGEHNFTLCSIAKLEAVLGEEILTVVK